MHVPKNERKDFTVRNLRCVFVHHGPACPETQTKRCCRHQPCYAEHAFEWDLSVAVVMPLGMAMSVALALDPWVAAQEAGGGSGAAGWAVHRAFQQGLGTTQQVCARSL